MYLIEKHRYELKLYVIIGKEILFSRLLRLYLREIGMNDNKESVHMKLVEIYLNKEIEGLETLIRKLKKSIGWYRFRSY